MGRLHLSDNMPFIICLVNWNKIALQCCIIFCSIVKWTSYICVHISLPLEPPFQVAIEPRAELPVICCTFQPLSISHVVVCMYQSQFPIHLPTRVHDMLLKGSKLKDLILFKPHNKLQKEAAKWWTPDSWNHVIFYWIERQGFVHLVISWSNAGSPERNRNSDMLHKTVMWNENASHKALSMSWLNDCPCPFSKVWVSFPYLRSTDSCKLSLLHLGEELFSLSFMLCHVNIVPEISIFTQS